MKKICIASDHAGFFLKKNIISFLEDLNYDVTDYGTNSSESMDYPDVAHLLGKDIDNKVFEKGIIICGSGNGVNMVVNKYNNVRSALCWNEEIVKLARQHNDANVVAIPTRFLDDEKAISIVKLFLNTEFESGRHLTRVNKIKR